jgi:hypothetical protein
MIVRMFTHRIAALAIVGVVVPARIRQPACDTN